MNSILENNQHNNINTNVHQNGGLSNNHSHAKFLFKINEDHVPVPR